MKTYKYIKTMFVCLCLLSTNVVYANNQLSIEFFASNNTNEINLQKAYARLKGIDQSELQNGMIRILQKNHIEQGTFEDILGTYRMSNDKNITADNTEHFSTSPNQNLSDDQIFSLAKELGLSHRFANSFEFKQLRLSSCCSSQGRTSLNYRQIY